jgi:hypothetical protein
MPELEHSTAERRQIVSSVFDRIWVQDRALTALTARTEVYPLLQAVSRCVYGVADGARTRNILIHSQVLCH